MPRIGRDRDDGVDAVHGDELDGPPLFSVSEYALKTDSSSFTRSLGRLFSISNRRTRWPANVSESNSAISSMVRFMLRALSWRIRRLAGSYTEWLAPSP